MLVIIIPYYKIHFFKATLDSLANQTDKRFKVYIGDDASPENPSDLLEKYKGQFDFVYHRFKTNLGSISLTQQWERCIGLSNEEWIQILGDDDCVSSNFVDSFYSNLNEIVYNKSSVVRFATQIIDEKGNKVSNQYTHPKLELNTDFINRKFSKLTRSSLSEYVFKSDVVKKYKFYDFPLAWHSDDLAVIQFSDNQPIFSINQALVYVRQSSYSITGSADNIKLKARATQQFILNFIFSAQYELSDKTIELLQKKIEYAFICDKSLEYYFKIAKYYLSKFKFYECMRLNYLIIRNK